MKSNTYGERRYFIPSSLLASQTTKTTAQQRKRALKTEPLTYAKLLERQSQLATSGQLNAQTAANRSTALKLFLKANHLQTDDVVGLEMRPNYPLAVDTLVLMLRAEGRTDRSISNSRSALNAWKRDVIADDTHRSLASELPTPFVAELRKLTDGHTICKISRQIRVSKGMLYGWLNGKSPRASNSNYLRRIEAFFGIERDSLVQLAGIQGNFRPREKIGASPEISYRRKLSNFSGQKYCLKPAPDSPLRAQWTDFIQHKTAVMPALQRSNRGRWSISQLKVIQATEANWARFIDGAEVPSAGVAWSQTTSYLGWLALPNERGGSGIDANELQTLAWLVVPNKIEAYLAWCISRADGKVSQFTSTFLGFIASLVRPQVGYLRQQDGFLKSLPTSFANRNWDDLCEEQFQYISRLQRAYVTEVTSSRDPFEPIRSVLSLEQPLEAVADMVQRMRLDRPNGTILEEAIWARDLFLVKLLVSNPLRLRNLITLTWSLENINGHHPNDKAALYQQVDGTWWLFVPKVLFKNRRSKAMKHYDSPVHPSVWTDLERYLFRHRRDLVRWPTDLVFLTKTRNPNRIEKVKGDAYKKAAPACHKPYIDMSRHVFQLTKRYLWNCDGIGTQAFRHLVATGILKAVGGDVKTAALVLNDSESMVEKHYSGMRSGDGSKRMGELLGATFSRM